MFASAQWAVIVNTIAYMAGMQILIGFGGTVFGLGMAAILPAAFLSLANTNYKKTIPAIIILLSRVLMKNSSYLLPTDVNQFI
ncbi:hypothetical protein QUF80_15905 [Desulfococcaceae bacterium HSG8]|nr:hypothetical protein [Desulfococcaceae bacterium HSG8]